MMKRYLLIVMCVVAQMSGMEQPKEHWSDRAQLSRYFQQFLCNIVSYKAEPLAGGLLSEAPVLCTVNDKKYVARRFKGSLDDLRIKERIYCVTCCTKLAPTMRTSYIDRSNDYLYIITDFINVPTLSLEQARKSEVISCVAQKLRLIGKCHEGMATNNKETVFDEIMRMHNAIEKKKIVELAAVLKEMKDTAEMVHQKIKEDKRPLIINHNDFHPRNIFFIDNDIKIIDWDTICLNYQFYDVAGYSLFTCLNKEQDMQLLTEYLECQPTQSDIDYFKKVKLAGRVCLVLSGLQFVDNVLEDIPAESIEDFEHYATAFARDNSSDSSQFFYKFGMSQLKELRREYKELENM
jgi:thiamine kinase-like enzyme